MSTVDPICNDAHYKRLSYLITLSALNPVEQVLFLSTFESWFYFQEYALYESLALSAISTLEELYSA